MVKRSSKRTRKEAGDSSSALKMVLKLSAQEHADSMPASPSASALSQESDDDKPGAKKPHLASASQQSPAGTSGRKGTKYWLSLSPNSQFHTIVSIKYSRGDYPDIA